MRVGGCLSIPVDLLPLGIAESDRGHEESEPHLSRAEARMACEATPHKTAEGHCGAQADGEPRGDSIECVHSRQAPGADVGAGGARFASGECCGSGRSYRCCSP